MPKSLTTVAARVLSTLVLSTLVLGALLAGGCHRTADTAQTENTAININESSTSTDDGSDESASSSRVATIAEASQPKIRQAVRDFVREKYPDSKVEGVWTMPFRDNYCLAAADVTTSSRRRTVDVLVRLYVRENGSEYWRAESFGHDARKLLFSQPSSPEPLSEETAESTSND